MTGNSNLMRLRAPAAPRDRLEADAPANGGSDDAQLRHQPIELRREHRLRPIAERMGGIAVHLDDQAVGAGGDPRPRPPGPHVPAAAAPARLRYAQQIALT